MAVQIVMQGIICVFSLFRFKPFSIKKNTLVSIVVNYYLRKTLA